MSMELIVAMNIVAVAALLALLTAAMRLPYRLSRQPRGEMRVPQARRRLEPAAPAPRPSRARRGTPATVYSR